MKQIIKKLLLFFSLTISIQSVSYAENPFEMSLEENVNTPEVPSKKHNAVKETTDRLRLQLERAGYNVARLRQGEALMVSIPCSILFRNNADTISPEGVEKLEKLKLLDDWQSKFKTLIAVHTDNTGDDSYADAITAHRANAIDDFLTKNIGLSSMTIIPYGLGRDEPLANNDSVSGRAKNRRVELFFVPLETLFSKNAQRK